MQAITVFDKAREALEAQDAAERESMAAVQAEARQAVAAATAAERETHELEAACTALQRQIDARASRIASESALQQSEAGALQRRVEDLEVCKAPVFALS